MLAAAPARADWAYTHWGMTAEQVAAASSGAVRVTPPAQRTRDEADHWEIAAEGQFKDGGRSFPVGFMFDTRTGGLRCVMYNAFGADVAAVRADLVKRYGAPSGNSEFGSSHTLTWRQPEPIEWVAGDRPLAAVITHCRPDRG